MVVSFSALERVFLFAVVVTGHPEKLIALSDAIADRSVIGRFPVFAACVSRVYGPQNPWIALMFTHAFQANGRSANRATVTAFASCHFSFPPTPEPIPAGG